MCSTKTNERNKKVQQHKIPHHFGGSKLRLVIFFLFVQVISPWSKPPNFGLTDINRINYYHKIQLAGFANEPLNFKKFHLFLDLHEV